ncbi:hypothetical protein A9Q96_14580 [Rhodobacterales bacterium 52_120_T64]|nr:hypothetical protein A9Q96_14580 [Rhodobacterales bacterium 52_120_T64]
MPKIAFRMGPQIAEVRLMATTARLAQVAKIAREPNIDSANTTIWPQARQHAHSHSISDCSVTALPPI